MVNLFKIALLACLVATTFAVSINGSVSEILIDQHEDAKEFHRIILKPNLTDIIEKELKSQNKSFKLNKIIPNSNNNLKYNLVHETENTIYLVTMVDHPSKLNVTFNYKVNPKRTIKERYGFSILPFQVKDEDFNSSNVKTMEMEFKNLKFSEFLAKEHKLLNFVDNVLFNDNVFIIGIENKESNLLVKLGRSDGFSKSVKILKQQSCDQNGDFLNKFNEEVGLELVPCSIKINQKEALTLSNFPTGSLDFDIDILVSSSKNLNINYILFLFIIIVQIFF